MLVQSVGIILYTDRATIPLASQTVSKLCFKKTTNSSKPHLQILPVSGDCKIDSTLKISASPVLLPASATRRPGSYSGGGNKKLRISVHTRNLVKILLDCHRRHQKTDLFLHSEISLHSMCGLLLFCSVYMMVLLVGGDPIFFVFLKSLQ